MKPRKVGSVCFGQQLPPHEIRAGGAPKMQGSEGRMTGRIKTPCCGPRAEYTGSEDDFND